MIGMLSQNVPKLCSSLFYRIVYFADILALKSLFFVSKFPKTDLTLKLHVLFPNDSKILLLALIFFLSSLDQFA